MAIPHNIVRFEDKTESKVSVTAYINGRMYVADESHPQINLILDVLNSGDADDYDGHRLADLFDATAFVVRQFESITDRVTMLGGSLYFDGDPVVNRLSDTIVRLVRDGEDFNPMVKFLENLMQNPNEHSRDMLFDWMQANGGFTITPDGHFIAYKGVRENGLSVSSGTAIVDGKVITGNIPNKPGSVITMPRSEVEHDPGVACHVGLHVGVWAYAHGFGGGHTLKIKVNPRDVVSVPSDCAAQKMRVCRYEVLERIDAPVESVIDQTAVDDDWERDDIEPTVMSEWTNDRGYDMVQYWDEVTEDEWVTCSCPAFRYSGSTPMARSCKHGGGML